MSGPGQQLGIRRHVIARRPTVLLRRSVVCTRRPLRVHARLPWHAVEVVLVVMRRVATVLVV